jgi:hypothetical protein
VKGNPFHLRQIRMFKLHAHSYNSNDSFAVKYLIHVPKPPETPVFEPQLFNSKENLDFAEDLQLNHEQLTEINFSGSNLLPSSVFSSKHFTHTKIMDKLAILSCISRLRSS